MPERDVSGLQNNFQIQVGFTRFILFLNRGVYEKSNKTWFKKFLNSWFPEKRSADCTQRDR